jgi:predicted esterase
MSNRLHQGQPVIQSGTHLADANLAVVLLHGRGATAESMGQIAAALSMDGAAFIIPQAAMQRWYPNTAFGPLEANEPDLSSALELIDSLVQQAIDQGLSKEQIAFGGFSQGACLAAEYVVRNADRYASLFVFSGALIGPPGVQRSDPGSFDGMPAFIGGSDVDPWVTFELMQDTASVLERMGAEVDFRTYPGMGHTVNMDEIDAVRKMLLKARS